MAATHEYKRKTKKTNRSKKIRYHVTNGLSHYADVRNTEKDDGGAEGVRTPDLLNAIQALYQLSYDPIQNDANLRP